MCNLCDEKKAIDLRAHGFDWPLAEVKPAKRPSKAPKAPKPSEPKASVGAPKVKPTTHEELIQAVYGMALQLPTLTKEDKEKLRSIKLTYGAGPDGVRGITYYKLWSKQAKGKDAQVIPFVAVCATGQSDQLQVIGTTLHELGHVLAGWGAAHGPAWHAACERLGLVKVRAAGTEYSKENFIEEYGFRAALLRLPKPKDGAPVTALQAGLPVDPLGGLLGGLGIGTLKLKPCGAGYGAKGGKSRGKGSGSRLLKYSCGCTIVRASAGADLKAVCSKCGKAFKQDGEPVEPVDPPAAPPVAPAAPGAGPAKGKGKGKQKGKRPGQRAQRVGAAARSRMVNAPLIAPFPSPPAPQAPGGDSLAAILNRIDPK